MSFYYSLLPCCFHARSLFLIIIFGFRMPIVLKQYLFLLLSMFAHFCCFFESAPALSLYPLLNFYLSISCVMLLMHLAYTYMNMCAILVCFKAAPILWPSLQIECYIEFLLPKNCPPKEQVISCKFYSLSNIHAKCISFSVFKVLFFQLKSITFTFFFSALV